MALGPLADSWIMATLKYYRRHVRRAKLAKRITLTGWHFTFEYFSENHFGAGFSLHEMMTKAEAIPTRLASAPIHLVIAIEHKNFSD
jgi:hypothetical protein